MAEAVADREPGSRRKPALSRRDALWVLRRCGRRGHVLADVDDSISDFLRGTDGLDKPLRRCLRCAAYTHADDIAANDVVHAESLAELPLVVRGAHGRRLALLRVVAAERFLRGLFLAAAAFGAFMLAGNQQGVLDWFDRLVSSAGPLGQQLGWDTLESPTLHRIESLLAHSDSAYIWLGIGLAAYACVQVVEGVGLWGGWRWAEYLAAIATSVFIPWEVFEVIKHPSLFKAVLLPLNIAIVVYLVFKGRLFGVRGGHSAWLAEVRNATFTADLLRLQGRSPDLLTSQVVT